MELTNITPVRFEEVKHYSIEFRSADMTWGYGFDSDELGNIKLKNDVQEESYKYCISHPEEFTGCFNKFTIRTTLERIPSTGKCTCGKTIVLEGFRDVCQCPKCGRRYNLFGNEILPTDCGNSSYFDEPDEPGWDFLSE